jgi:tripartite-type tricarboxylate transporter receptor subunit TctC
MKRKAVKKGRHLLTQIALGCAALAFTGVASAQNYPAKPIRVLIATSAGSNPDTVARIVATRLGTILGQQVIVDNRAGAGGNIGAEVAARAPADGYTVLFAHTNHSINVGLYQKLAYDIVSDFAPVTLVARSPFVATVHPSLPAKSLRDLINIAKSRPGDLTYASAGTGSGTFFSAEYFNSLARVKMLHVAYKGGGPALAAVVAGETSVYFTPYATGLPHMRSGRLRPLGVSTLKRLADLPDIPAIAETLPGYEVLAWNGLMVPAKTPRSIIDTLHKAMVSALADPEVAKRLNELGFLVVGSRPEEMVAYVKSEIDKYGKLIRQIGLPPQ